MIIGSERNLEHVMLMASATTMKLTSSLVSIAKLETSHGWKHASLEFRSHTVTQSSILILSKPFSIAFSIREVKNINKWSLKKNTAKNIHHHFNE